MSNINFFAILCLLILFGFIALVSFFVYVQLKRKTMSRFWWMVLISSAIIFGMIQFGPIIGKAVGKEHLFSVPKALITIEMGKAGIVPLTSDAKKLVGRRGPAERELTEFLAERGWTFKDHLGAAIIYEKGNDTLIAIAHFRKGYWWYDLNKAP